MDSPHKGQWRRTLMLSMRCTWKRLSKQSTGRWFETLVVASLWYATRHNNQWQASYSQNAMIPGKHNLICENIFQRHIDIYMFGFYTNIVITDALLYFSAKLLAGTILHNIASPIDAGIILCMGSANGKRRYRVSPLLGWTHTLIDITYRLLHKTRNETKNENTVQDVVLETAIKMKIHILLLDVNMRNTKYNCFSFQLMFSLVCTWINAWVNNREAGDLRRHRAHHDVIVMIMFLLRSISQRKLKAS